MQQKSGTKARLEILSGYKLKCKDLNLDPNSALIRTLEEPGPEEFCIDIIFRGNYKLNFSNRLQDQDLIILTSLLENYTELIRNIDFSYNKLTESSIRPFAKLLSKLPNLESLNLQGNNLDVEGAKLLAEAIKENKTLQYLNLNENNIQTDGVLQIILILFANKNLKELNLADNKIDHDGMSGIASVLNWHNSTLEVLNLDKASYKSIGQEIAIHFAKMLQNNKGLQKLSLRKHELNCDALYIMTEHMLENNRLRVLDLSANRIAFQGCEALGKFLISDYCNLESLILANNRTGVYGAKALALALSKNKTLIHLDMTTNNINDDGLRMLGDSLYLNNTLASLKLYWNDFDQSSLKVFHDLLTNVAKETDRQFFFDFETYIVDDHIEMCLVEKKIPYDVEVSSPYYIE